MLTTMVDLNLCVCESCDRAYAEFLARRTPSCFRCGFTAHVQESDTPLILANTWRITLSEQYRTPEGSRTCYAFVRNVMRDLYGRHLCRNCGQPRRAHVAGRCFLQPTRFQREPDTHLWWKP